MKSLLIDCSPKKRGSTSSYLLSHLSIQIPGKKEKIKLIPKNYADICEKLNQVDAIVLAMPIYVDGVPASVLKFFEYVQAYVKGKDIKIKVYSVVNCGFYEGNQTKSTFSIISNWCDRCGFDFRGGIGQGAGEMIGVIRYVNFFLAVFITLILFVVQCFKLGSEFTLLKALSSTNYINAIVNVVLYFVFNIFMYVSMCRLGRDIRKNRQKRIIYSTVFCPRFLFVIFADIFWVVKALFRGKMFFSLYNKGTTTEDKCNKSK